MTNGNFEQLTSSYFVSVLEMECTISVTVTLTEIGHLKLVPI